MPFLAKRLFESHMPNSGQAPLDRATRLRRVADVLATEVGGEMVMMDVEKGVYFGLDPIGTDIWKRLEAPMGLIDAHIDAKGFSCT